MLQIRTIYKANFQSFMFKKLAYMLIFLKISLFVRNFW